jgi:GntR family transcriptional regulator/MocR family aminotransferase
MPKHASGALLAMISLDRAASMPLFRQLDEQLRAAVLTGRLSPGTRLPSTRELARELEVSRLTVQNCYEQLIAEGYLEAAVGAGTFVARIDPQDLPPQRPAVAPTPSDATREASRRGCLLRGSPASTRLGATRPFRSGVPALDLFPMRTWSRLWSKTLNRSNRSLLGYGEPGGYRALREAIAGYLKDARGVDCGPEQVIVTAGAQQAFHLAAITLLDIGDWAWIEDPGHIAGRGALAPTGVEIASVPINDEGLDLAAGRQRHPSPKMIIVTPSRQHPLGITMSLRRRLELLQFAQSTGAWILEDDYDSEFRYAGRPLAAMQGLDETGCVIYVGTFSKVLFPSLRLGYAVVPESLVETFRAAQTVISQGIPQHPQAVLADFILEGYFTAHLRKMRAAYAERQALLVDRLERRCGGLLEVAPVTAGMHLIAWLPEGSDDKAVSRAVWAKGVETLPLSIYAFEAKLRPGLLLGFTCVRPEEIAPCVDKLAAALAG